MHNTLVTQERLSKTNPNTSPYCKFPCCPGIEKEDTLHDLLHCPGVGVSIFSSIQSLVHNLQVQDAICLDLNAVAVAWSSLWDLRQKRTRPQLYLVRAQMEARIASATVDTIIATT